MSGDSPASGVARDRPIRVLHIITRMIVGGAQENTMLSCALADPRRFTSEILSGVETGEEGELHGETRRRGVPLHFEPAMVRAPSLLKDVIALVRMTRFLRRHRVDVVHTHTSKAGILGRIAAKLAGVKHVVHTVHGWGFHPMMSRSVYLLYSVLERWCAPLCDLLLVVATQDREEGLALGIGRREQYRLVRSGIEIETFRDVVVDPAEVRASLGIPFDAFVVGSVGRLSPQKSPLDLLQAFTALAAVRPEAHLLIVGDGPLRGEMESTAAARGLTGRVHLPGIRRDVPRLLRAMDVFALTSRWEGLPRVFPQAMCASLPILATRVDGATDIVVPGENGWLFEVGDMDGFAKGLVELAGDPARRRQMGARGLAAVEEFSLDRMVERLEAIYEALVERRPAPLHAGDAIAGADSPEARAHG